MPSSVKHQTYRPDIDGLRAIAVLSVIVYHYFADVLRGGFVGVDIFFVISGFLITSIILRETYNNNFKLSSFYARRIKRIFPALILILFTCLVLGWGVLLKGELQQLGNHVVATASFVVNLILLRESGYFDSAIELKPLMHLWSLGVEEQYYIFWPLLLAFFLKSRTSFLLIFGGSIVISFVLNIIWMSDKPEWSFFLPVTRFWELSIGGLLGYFFIYKEQNDLSFKSIPPTIILYLCNALSLLGLVFIILAIIFIDETKSFPGWWAILPTLGTVFIIAAGKTTWLAKNILSQRILVFIGLISYPLYLWHWPLLSFTRIIYNGLPNINVRIFIVLVTFILAWLTYAVVEIPLKNYSRQSRKNSKIVVSSLSVIMILLLVVGVATNTGRLESRLKNFDELSIAAKDWNYPGDKKAIIKGNPQESVLFFGDSFIQQLYPRMEELARIYQGNHRTILFKTSPGCAPISKITRTSDPECISTVRSGFELAKQENIKAVVIGGSWLGMTLRNDYFNLEDPEKSIIDFNDYDNNKWIFDHFTKEIKAIKEKGKDVFVVLNPAGGDKAGPLSLGWERFSNQKMGVKTFTMEQHIKRTGRINNIISAAAKSAGATVIDPINWLCSVDRCSFSSNDGTPYMRDNTHYRASFVRCCIKSFDAIVVSDVASNNS